MLLLLPPRSEVLYHVCLWGIVVLTVVAAAAAFRVGSGRKLVHRTAKFAAIYLVAIFPLTVLTSQNPVPAAPSDMLPALRSEKSNEFPVATESLEVGLEQGDCVNLDQALGRTQLNKVQCGDSSAFRVIQIVSTLEQCVNDADLTYYSATKRYAACLDYDWSPDRCLLIEQGQPVRKVDCATPRSERVELIVMSTDNTLNCSQGVSLIRRVGSRCVRRRRSRFLGCGCATKRDGRKRGPLFDSPAGLGERTPGQAGDFHFCGSSGDSAASCALAARPGLPIRRLSAYTGAAARATSGGIAWRALRVLKSPAFMPIPIKVIATIAAIPTNVVVIRPTVSSSADQRLRGVAAGDHDGAKRRAPHQPMPATAAGARIPPATRAVPRPRHSPPRRLPRPY